MKKTVLQMIALAAVAVAPVLAQGQLPGTAAAPAAGDATAAGPSKEEVEAFQKMDSIQIQSVADADRKIAAGDDFQKKFPASTLKAYVFSMMGEAAQLKGDAVKAVFYFEEALKADPKDYNSMLMISMNIAQGTQEFDLNKDAKLTRATKLATDGIALAEAAPKPNPQVADAQWEEVRKDDIARGHEALGMIAMVKKEFNTAVTEFQSSLSGAAHPNPTTMIRLGGALNEAGKPDDAIKVLDQVIAMQGLPQQFIDVAKNERTRSTQIKSQKK